jgi:hypothetical protein
MASSTFFKKLSHSSTHNFYIKLYQITTFVIIGLYIIVHLGLTLEFGDKYLGLLVTVRNIVLGIVLIYLYNPFRTTYNYGRFLPIIASGAGVALLLTVKKMDLINLYNFFFERNTAKNADSKVDQAQDDANKEIQVSKKI